MPSSLKTRLRRLEAWRPAVADPPYTPPAFPPGWWAEFFAHRAGNRQLRC
jgi:hypothetical protein